MPPPTVKHPGLSSTFTGLVPKSSDGVWQFRGIKYADIPARFTQSVLNEKFPAEYDATKYGPKCPHVNFPIRLEDALIGISPEVASNQEHIFDEWNCLNLNITTPASSRNGSNFPVLLYIHGGGGHSGANSDWWNDGSSIVKRSIELGQPVVMVAINYRLAVLGWIGSSELQDKLGKANGGNYSVRDQHTAIEWVFRHIAPFGGDPSNITIYGESAGAQGVHSHVSSLLPSYFSRAVLQSMTLGTPVFSDPQSIAEKTWVYNRVKEALKVTTVEELQQVPWRDLLKAYDTSDPRHGYGEVGMIDDEFYSEAWRDRLVFASGKGELLLGTTGHEQAVIAVVLLQYPKCENKPTTQSLIDNLRAIAPPAKTDALLEAYSITPETEGKDLVEDLLALCADLMFYAPASWISAHAKKGGIDVHEYAFEQKQPFGGIFKGTASHALDLAYLHGDPSIFASGQDMKIQRELQETWINFAYGNTNWESDEVKVFGPDGTVATLEKEVFERQWRRGQRWEAARAFEAGEIAAICPALVGYMGQLMGTA